MKILALDLGKFKSVACIYDTDLTPEQDAVYRTIPTTPDTLHQLLTEIDPGRLVFEIGNQAGWVRDLAESFGVEYECVNSRDERWKWVNVKTKTDRKDALKLARLSAMGESPTVVVPDRSVRQRKKLIHYRQSLVGRRVEITNHIRALFDAEGLALPGGTKAWSVVGRRTLAGFARPLTDDLDVEELWRGQLHEELAAYETVCRQIKRVEQRLETLNAACADTVRLQKIPGVGPRCAEMLVTVLGDAKRFKSAKQVASYIGLTPRLQQSGEMLRLGRISKQGDRRLRSLLVEVAWISRRWNPAFKNLFEHLTGGNPKRRKQAAVALGRRILVVAWSMLKHQTEWDPAKVGPPPQAAVAVA